MQRHCHRYHHHYQNYLSSSASLFSGCVSFERLVSPVAGHKLPRLLVISVFAVMTMRMMAMMMMVMMMMVMVMIVMRADMIMTLLMVTLTSRPWMRRALPTGSPCKGSSEAPASHK